MPKSKRRLPQAESETISRVTPASVEESGASEVEEEIAEERDLDERQGGAEEPGEAREVREALPTQTISARCCKPS